MASHYRPNIFVWARRGAIERANCFSDEVLNSLECEGYVKVRLVSKVNKSWVF